MSTVTDLIEETRGHLHGFHKPQLNRLGADATAAAPTVTVEFTTDTVARGSTICIDDELMYVWSTSGGILTVERGYLGTTAATHSDGALIEINPRHPTPYIRAELRKEIASWGVKIWDVVAVEVDVGLTQRTLELPNVPADFLHVVGARRPSTAAELAPRELEYRYERGYGNRPTLVLKRCLPEAQTIEVLYAVPFDLTIFEDDVDLVDELRLPASALDIPPLGAAWRLVATREISRNEISAAPEPRVNQDVPAQALIAAARALKGIRDDRLGEEARLLQHKYGLRTP